MAFGTLYGIGNCGCAMPNPTPSGASLPSCFCVVPYTLSMTSGDPSCNYRMFQSTTLQYGPPPPSMRALNFTSNVFTSTEQFVDPLTGSSFFYYFYCNYNAFYLTRIFPTSPFGSPYRDGILYSWTTGGYGNSCSPFALDAGSAYPGSDASCSVAVDGGGTQTPPGTDQPANDPPVAGGSS